MVIRMTRPSTRRLVIAKPIGEDLVPDLRILRLHANSDLARKPCPAIALRGFQRAPGTGKLPAHYHNGPPWNAQLPTILPHTGRGLPGPFHIRHSLGTIHGNQIQETIVLVRHNRLTANEHASHPSMERVRWASYKPLGRILQSARS